MIYETSGRAREYYELAANLYTGCEHACLYCYGADVAHKEPSIFFGPAEPRAHCLEELKRDAVRLANKAELRHILVSFITDPYQPVEDTLKITRQAIEIIHSYTLFVAILTKGGMRAARDFDILTQWDHFGVSLTSYRPETKAKWEPKPAPWDERIRSLIVAKDKGIPTWVSCEPVLDPAETLQLIAKSAPYVDVFKVGTLNYRKEADRIHWKQFAKDVVALLNGLGKSYYIKKDLARFLGQPEGITVGKVPK